MGFVRWALSDGLYAAAKSAGLNVSQLAQRAVATELGRLAKVAELDAYLAELEVELGPVSASEQAEARAWAAKVLGPDKRRRSA